MIKEEVQPEEKLRKTLTTEFEEYDSELDLDDINLGWNDDTHDKFVDFLNPRFNLSRLELESKSNDI